MKEYDRSFKDPNSFEWAQFDEMIAFIEPLLPFKGTPTDIGVWSTPIDIADLKAACSYEVEDGGWGYIREAISIAVLADWKELGSVISFFAEEGDGEMVETIACARAAELLGTFSSGILPRIRDIVEIAEIEAYDVENDYEDPAMSKLLSSAAGLLVRHGTDEDRKKIMLVIDEASPASGYPMLYTFYKTNFNTNEDFIADQFMDLQRTGFPANTEQNINNFCELTAKTEVPIDWQRLIYLQKLDWIEGILIRILRTPSEFEAQREGLREALNIIRNGSPSGPLAIIALRRLGEEPELLRPFLDESNKWEDRVAAHIALIDVLPNEYFAERDREEEEAGLQAVYMFLADECTPGTPLSDLELMKKITEEPLLQKIFFNDQRLRATQQSYTGLFQAAVTGEKLTDTECALLLSALEGDGYGTHPLGSVVLFHGGSPLGGPGFGYRLFSAILSGGGPETRALLLHRLFMKDNLWDYLNPLLVLTAYLDGPRSWIEPILSRFYGLEQSKEEPWLEGKGSILIESLQNAYEYNLESIAMSMTEAELHSRPGLLSRMWEHPNFLLRQRAWRVASKEPGIHPLLSPPVEPKQTQGEESFSPGKDSTTSYSRPSVAIAHSLVSDENTMENWDYTQTILSQIEPEFGWPEALKRLIRWRESEWQDNVGQ